MSRAVKIDARHEFSFHHAGDLMVSLCSLPEKRVDLVDKDDTWLRFAGETEQASYKLVRFTIPFVGQDRGSDVDKSGSRLLSQRFGEHGFAAAWWAVEENTFRCRKEGGSGSEEVGIDERVYNSFTKVLDDRI